MGIRFLHTADLQLGKTYRNIPGDQGAKLRELRLEVIDRILALAKARNVHFILIAGDFFDANTLDDRCVLQTCERFKKSPVPIYVIPGNHDYGGAPDSIYRRDSFRRAQPDCLKILESTEPILLAEGRAVLLPAPLLQRHSTRDTAAHMDGDHGRDLAPDAIRIGMAHGGVIGFGDREEESAVNLLDPARAEKGRLDYFALGDWHGLYRVNDRTWYSGTPEPDRFKNNEPGNVLIVSVAAAGEMPHVEPVRVAQTRWIEHDVSFHSPADVQAFAHFLDGVDDPLHTVLKVRISGVLPLAENKALGEICAGAAGRFLYLKLEGSVLPQPTQAEIDGIAAAGFLKDTVDQLRTQEGAVPALALQLLYEAMQSGATP